MFLHRCVTSSLVSNDCVFQAGMQSATTPYNVHPHTLTNFKVLAIYLTVEVHDDLVAVLGFMPFGRGFVALLLRRNTLDGLVNLLVLDLSGQALQLQAIDGRRSEERRVGKECVSMCRSRWSTYH